MYLKDISFFSQNLLNILKRMIMFKVFFSLLIFFVFNVHALVDSLGRTYNYVYYSTAYNQSTGIRYSTYYQLVYPWNGNLSVPLIYDAGSSLLYYFIDIAGSPSVQGIGHYSTYNRVFSNCPNGTYPDSMGICKSPPPLSTYDSNITDCSNHGGWSIVISGVRKCDSKAQFEADIKQLKIDYIIGRGITFGKYLITGVGVASLAWTTVPVAASVVVHSIVGGAIWWGFNNISNIKPDLNTGDAVVPLLKDDKKTIKIDLVNYTPSTSSAPTGKLAIEKDDTTGKVTHTLYIPDKVITDMVDPSKVDFVNNAPSAPLDLTGVKDSTFDYENNTVSTKTYDSTGASTINVSPFSVTQNPDGSVTSIPSPSSGAPTVSGSGDGSASAPSSPLTSSIGDATNDMSKSLSDAGSKLDQIHNDIKDGNSKLDNIKKLLDTDGKTNPELSDGSSAFGEFGARIKDSFTVFNYLDPLALNSLGGGIQSYGFTLYGRHFVILDQLMIDQLPLDMMRKLFLFIAALMGLISVVSGV